MSSVSMSDLLDALRNQESGGNSRAVSKVGARGAYQFMPATWNQYGQGGDPFDPVAGRRAAGNYLTDLYKKLGSVELALAGYNAGANAVIKNGYQIPPYKETQNYVKSIFSMLGLKPTGNTTLGADGKLVVTDVLDGTGAGVNDAGLSNLQKIAASAPTGAMGDDGLGDKIFNYALMLMGVGFVLISAVGLSK